MHTPWGKSDSSTQLARGIMEYGTPGHGGIRLSPARQAKVPQFVLDEGEPSVIVDRSGAGWYEEDVGWSLAVLSFHDELKDSDNERARMLAGIAMESAKQWHPRAAAKFREIPNIRGIVDS